MGPKYNVWYLYEKREIWIETHKIYTGKTEVRLE
jgi:hypothetical protein